MPITDCVGVYTSYFSEAILLTTEVLSTLVKGRSHHCAQIRAYATAYCERRCFNEFKHTVLIIIVLWTRQTRWQTSRRANLNPMARWPFVSLGRYSRQPISYVDRAATDAGTVADMTATRKTEKYLTLSSAYRFEPIAVENLGVFNSTTLNFIYFRTRPP